MVEKYLKKCFQIIDSLIYYFFCKKKVLFYIKNEIGYLQQRPVIERLKENEKVKLFFILDSKCELSYEFVEQDLKTLKSVSSKALLFTKFSCIVVSDFYPHWHIRKSPVFLLGHGSAVGNGSSEVEDWCLLCWKQLNINVCFVNSRAGFEHLELLPKSAKNNPDKIFLLGGSIKQNSAKKTILSNQEKVIKVSHSIKTIVIFSHYTRYSLLIKKGNYLVETILHECPDVEIIITGHPKLWTEKTTFGYENDTIIFDYLTEIARNQDRVTFHDGAATEDLLASGDLFLCDYSSIRVELAAWDKPTFLYVDKEFEFQSEKTKKMYINSSHTFSTLEDLSRLLVQWDENLLPETKIKNKEIYGYFSYDPEGSLDRCVNAINELLLTPYIGSSRWKRFREKSAEDLSKTFKIN